MKTLVKIVGNKGYIKQGSIGIGFGAWGRAASIRIQLRLSDFPVSLEKNKWEALSFERIVEIDSSINWKNAREAAEDS